VANVPVAAQEHYQRMQALQVLAVTAARRAWGRVDQARISESWREALREVAPVVAAVQVRAAQAGASYGALTLAEQGSWTAPEAFVDPRAFGGYASDGRSLDGLLMAPAFSAKTYIGGGADAAQALTMGRSSLDGILRTVVADAGRQAAGVDIATRKATGWVRMLNPPSCARCAVLAGRFYRWNDGFLRHKFCDCIHVPSRAGSTQAARDEGLIDDPRAYFDSLPTAEQLRERYPDLTVAKRREMGLFSQEDAFTKDGARAIRDGADIGRVVNSRSGRSGLTTTAGTSPRGFASDLRGQRLTPEGIYQQAASREEALRLLERQGYIIPGGQTPRATEGFGQMGRGGRRVGARDAVERARVTGVRTGSRATMTAAERRLYDSEQRWLSVIDGRNPYSRDGSGLTPTISAQVETDYRRWLTSGGQIFTR